MKSILIVLPICFILIHHLDLKNFKVIVWGSSIILISSILVFYTHYLSNYTQSNSLLLSGKSLWVPYSHHIRYVMLIYFSICILGGLYFFKIQILPKKTNHFILLLLSFTLIVLSVRTGWVFLLIGIVSWIIFAIIYKKIHLKIVFALFIFITVLAFSIYQLPSVKNKISYMQFDHKQSTENYSDVGRMKSIELGWKISLEKWKKGWGEGNYQLEIIKNQENKSYQYAFLPHNQFVLILGNIGIVGVLLFIATFVFFIHNSIKDHNFSLFAYSIGMIAISLIEPILETQLGLLIFVLPLCLFSIYKWPQSVQ